MPFRIGFLSRNSAAHGNQPPIQQQPAQPTQPARPGWSRFYPYLRSLRITIGMLAFVNFMIIATALRFTATIDDSSSISFMDFQQIIINGALFIACLYSSFGRATISSTYRLISIWIISILSLVYAISLLARIQSKGGCSSSYFTEVTTRCTMQYIISSIQLLWTVLLLLDGLVSYRQCRDTEWHLGQRAQEEERLQQNAVYYQPDLSLYGTGGGGGGSGGGNEGSGDIRNHDIEHAGPSAVEMEPLPAYVPRPDKAQPRIIDTLNLPVPNLMPTEDAPTYYAPFTAPPPVGFNGMSGSTASASSSSSSSSLTPSGPGSLPQSSTTDTLSASQAPASTLTTTSISTATTPIPSATAVPDSSTEAVRGHS